nr:inositol 3-kinase [Ipomoea batatas]GMD15782.1 inositol 3-kinase [Ipomoea batatas]
MVGETPPARRSCLVVGNCCHDVLIKDGGVIAESLGGAASFISAVLDGFDVDCRYVSKVGPDFAYSVSHRPIVCSSSQTTVFHAYFSSEIKRRDRVLKRVRACDPIAASDLPDSEFDFGLAVGVGGEILPETLEKMIGICETVFVDIQALIRIFDPADGTVNHVDLKQTGFFHLLPRIGFLKASSDEAPYVDVEEARKRCRILVTNGNEGCTVFTENTELKIAPFPTIQVDPTGAGDSFLAGLVAGIAHGLTLPDSALLGNFFGSLTVRQMGHSKFDSQLLQVVLAEELNRGDSGFLDLNFALLENGKGLGSIRIACGRFSEGRNCYKLDTLARFELFGVNCYVVLYLNMSQLHLMKSIDAGN